MKHREFEQYESLLQPEKPMTAKDIYPSKKIPTKHGVLEITEVIEGRVTIVKSKLNGQKECSDNMKDLLSYLNETKA